MELKKKIGIVLKKINRHGRENIVAVILLNVFIAIGFCAVLWLLRSYSIDFCLRTLDQKGRYDRMAAAKVQIPLQIGKGIFDIPAGILNQ